MLCDQCDGGFCGNIEEGVGAPAHEVDSVLIKSVVTVEHHGDFAICRSDGDVAEYIETLEILSVVADFVFVVVVATEHFKFCMGEFKQHISGECSALDDSIAGHCYPCARLRLVVGDDLSARGIMPPAVAALQPHLGVVVAPIAVALNEVIVAAIEVFVLVPIEIGGRGVVPKVAPVAFCSAVSDAQPQVFHSTEAAGLEQGDDFIVLLLTADADHVLGQLAEVVVQTGKQVFHAHCGGRDVVLAAVGAAHISDGELVKVVALGETVLALLLWEAAVRGRVPWDFQQRDTGSVAVGTGIGSQRMSIGIGHGKIERRRAPSTL